MGQTDRWTDAKTDKDRRRDRQIDSESVYARTHIDILAGVARRDNYLLSHQLSRQLLVSKI